MDEEEEEQNVAIEALALSVFFLRGDANYDFVVNIADPVTTLNYLFSGAGTPACLDAVDANDDGELNISDALASLSTLFAGGAPLSRSECDRRVGSDDRRSRLQQRSV